MQLLIGICAVLVGLTFENAVAQNFPVKPIKVIIAFAPGGPQDLIARPVTQKLGDALGQPIVIDYKAGGNSIIGSDLVAKAPPDGYTLLVVSSTHTTNPSTQKSLPYDTLRDFVAVSPMARTDQVLVASPKLPANDLKDLIALAKQNPGKLNFASSGVGGSSHLAGEMLKLRANIDMVHISYKGAAQVLLDVMAGNVDVSFIPAPSVIQPIKDKKVKLLAVASHKRMNDFPDAATMAESGFPKFELYTISGLVGPAGMPVAAINRVNGALEKILATPDIKQVFAPMGLEPWWMPAQEMQTWLREEVERWSGVTKAIKYQPE